MPAQKRVQEDPEDEFLQHDHDRLNQHPEDGEAEGSDRIPSSSNGAKDEYVTVRLFDIRREVQCPICLGIIRKTRTVMECLHRFCRECIDKSMRLGNNECPACRTHCASRRSLRDDPNYDALIAALYTDIDMYEEEELSFQEEEKARNKQIQDSIAETLQRQSEALGRKQPKLPTRLQLRGRRNCRNAIELPESDGEDADSNDGGKNSSSADESMEPKRKKIRRRGAARLAQPSIPAASAYGAGDENDSEGNRETMRVSGRLVGRSERLAWGKGGMRSNTRYGSMSGGNGKNARNSRLSKLVDHLRNSAESNDELDIHLKLVSLDEQILPALKRPYLCCRPSLSVTNIRQYIALQTALQVDEVEIYLVQERDSKFNPPIPENDSVGWCKDKLRVLKEQDTLAELRQYSLPLGSLLLAYQKLLHGK